MNMPTNPVQTFPLSSTTTATSSVSTAPGDHQRPRLQRLVFAPDGDVEERQWVESQNQQASHRDSGEHGVHRGAAILGPVHVLQMQDQCELVEHQRRADPEKGCSDREFGYSPSTAKVTIDTPETMTKITPITTWWMCKPPPAEMLRGCHHLRGASLSAWLRMYRTIVRVTKNVRMKRDEAAHERQPPMRNRKVRGRTSRARRKLTPTCACHGRDTARLAGGHR
jgi:hypothetical protein